MSDEEKALSVLNAVKDEMMRYGIDASQYRVTSVEPPSGQDRFGLIRMTNDKASLWARVSPKGETYEVMIELL